MKVIYNKISNEIYIFVRDNATITFKEDRAVTIEDITTSYTLHDDCITDGETNVESFITSNDYYSRDPKDFVIKDGDVIPGKWLKIDQLRITRDKLLEDSDRLSLILWSDRWASRSDGEKSDWLNYRRELRDGFQKYYADPTLNPDNHVWPTIPEDDPVVVEVTEEASVDVSSDTPTGNTSPV